MKKCIKFMGELDTIPEGYIPIGYIWNFNEKRKVLPSLRNSVCLMRKDIYNQIKDVSLLVNNQERLISSLEHAQLKQQYTKEE